MGKKKWNKTFQIPQKKMVLILLEGMERLDFHVSINLKINFNGNFYNLNWKTAERSSRFGAEITAKIAIILCRYHLRK